MSDKRYTLGEYWLTQRKNRQMWYIAYYDASTRQTKFKTTGTTDLRQAKAIINDYFIKNSEIIDTTGQILLDAILVRYWHKHGKKVKRPDIIKYSLAHWTDFFREKTLEQITHKQIDKFIEYLQHKNLSNGSVNRILCDGRSALNRAYKYGEIKSAPFIKSLTKGESFKFRPTAKQIAQFIDACSTERTFRYIIIRLCTACRGDAVLDLTINQLDFENKLIELNPQGREQTKKYRPTIPMAPTLEYWLKKWTECTYLINYKNHQIKSIRQAWRLTRLRANLPAQFIGKSIRHVVATELRRQRVDRWEVSGLLGHSTGTTTDDYAIYDPQYLSQAIDSIEVFMVKIQQHCSRQILSKDGLRDNCMTNKKPFNKNGIYLIK